MAPTVLDHVTEGMELAWVEPFASVLPVIRAKSLVVNLRDVDLTG